MTDEELADHLKAVLAHLQEASDAHFRLPVLGTFLTTGHLGVLAERLLGWESDQTLQLLQGYSTVVDAADDLGAVVEAIRKDASAAKLLMESPALLVEHPGPAGEALRSHLERHGNQIVGMDLAHPTWAEDPTPLFTMIRSRLDHEESSRPNGKAAASTLEDQARSALSDRPEDLADFEVALSAARRGISLGDDTESDVLQVLGIVRYVAVEAGRRLTERKTLERPDDVLFFTEQELLGALRGLELDVDIARRRGEYLWAKGHRGPKRYGPEPAPMPSMRWAPAHARPFLEAMMWAMDKMAPPTRPEPTGDGVLVGNAASPGRVTGTVRIVRDPSEFDRIQPNDVLVCYCTIAAWSVIFPMLSAIITEVGGPLSHPGILAREFGIPAVLGVDEATTLLSDGQTVTVDGSSGRVAIHA
jgi:pyruvate,water dikinase